MSSLFSEDFFCAEVLDAFTCDLPEKVLQNDDAASTASGSFSDPASLPSSPGLTEATNASKTSSPATSSETQATTTVASLAPLTPEMMKDLPSIGSLGHFAGLCSR